MTSRLSLFFHSRVQSFRYAFAGCGMYCARSATPGSTPPPACWWSSSAPGSSLTRQEWALIVLAIALVWTAEFLNTALEAVVDLASQHAQHDWRAWVRMWAPRRC